MRKISRAIVIVTVFAAFVSSASPQRPAGPLMGSGQQGQIPIFVGTNTLGYSSLGQNPDGSISAGLSSRLGLLVSTNNSSNSSMAIFANQTATSGQTFGVFGQSASPFGIAVQGFHSANSGFTIGVQGISSSPDGWGVKGFGTGSNSVGVEGFSPNVGVRGNNLLCDNNGCAQTPGDAGQFITGSGGNILHGFLGVPNQPGGWVEKFKVDSNGTAFFAGDLNVTGNLTKGSGSFKIDHPLDPVNKNLAHSFVESPDMMNIYNGNIVTDAQGVATAVLPNYFEALNRDFRYQLTVIGEFALAMVAQEIENNRFTIKTDKPGVKVSWQVTGIRRDPFANAHRIKVEEEKPISERGHYLHPEVFGASEQPAIVGIRHRPLVTHSKGR